MRAIIHLILCLHLLAPIQAWAQTERDAFSYSLREYAVILGLSIAGGMVSWIAKMRRGEQSAASLQALIGELCTSAFAGLLTFWVCEYLGVHRLLVPAIVGVAGHLGTRLIDWAGDLLMRVVRRWEEARFPNGRGPDQA